MFAQMTNGLDFHAKALVLRAERQRVIASNIANADTPGYAARDLDFKEAMSEASGSPQLSGSGTTNSRHIPLTGAAPPGWPMLPKPNPAWTATVWTWTASAPTLSTTRFATSQPCASSTASPKPC